MADQSLSVPRTQKLKETASREFRRFLVIFLYLWVVFGVMSIHKSLVLSQHHLDTEEHTFAIINAFVFAKVLLVGEQLHLGTRFERKPLIYPILYRCLVFTVLMMAFHVAESVGVGLWHGHNVAESLPPFFGWNPKGVLAVSVLCYILLLPFFAFREIGRVIGRAEMWALIFKPRQEDPKLIFTPELPDPAPIPAPTAASSSRA
jgi:hypothetical protein